MIVQVKDMINMSFLLILGEQLERHLIEVKEAPLK
jgi:hypothetical protein